MAHLHPVLRALPSRLRVGGGRLAPGAGVGRGADDDLVNLHDGPLDRVGEGAAGGGSHVHDHAALRGRHLQQSTDGSATCTVRFTIATRCCAEYLLRVMSRKRDDRCGGSGSGGFPARTGRTGSEGQQRTHV